MSIRLHELINKKIAIWGTGAEGLSTLQILLRHIPSADVTMINDSSLSSDRLRELKQIKPDLPIVIGCQQNLSEALDLFDVVIKSPGISIYRPEIIEAKKKGICFTSSTQLWFNEHCQEKIIAVTGTKGKSTTTSLIAHMLRYLGYRVILAGNIGTPLIEMLDVEVAPDFWVLEMSSYQTSDFEGSVSVAVLLNLYPEHLDWHQSVENYYRDKLRLLAQVRDGVVVCYHSVVQNFEIDNLIHAAHLIYFNHSEGIHVRNRAIYDRDTLLIRMSDIPLLGEHNLVNLCAALSALVPFGIKPKQAVRALSTFTSLPHRLMKLGEKAGVLYVDDSISTIPQAAIAAMETFRTRPITILLGGFDRGIDMTVLVDYLLQHSVYAVITMPHSGLRISQAIRETTKVIPFQLYDVKDLSEAVKIAQKITPRNSVILLSPASPSFGAFKNYQERGLCFARLSGFG